MSKLLNNAALIMAAGQGTRAYTSKNKAPKQYRHLGQMCALEHAVNTFINHNDISAVCVVIHNEDKDLYFKTSHIKSNKIMEPIFGGPTRQTSVFNGLQALASYHPQNILIHDAARPFITDVLITNLIAALQKHSGVIPALPVTNTLKHVESKNTAPKNSSFKIVQTIPRTNLWQAQTPQCFHFEKILAAHQQASQSGLDDFTDDASIAEWYGLDVNVIDGDPSNRKITTPDDFIWAEMHLQQTQQEAKPMSFHKSQSRIFHAGSGFDVHAFNKATDNTKQHVTLCGVKIPHTHSLAGHSDADVGLHALTDALLGAIAEGDIGTHFPPSDPQWKEASSDIFLRDAMERIQKHDGIVHNVDITLICEHPKIGPHRDAMRTRLADIMEVPVTSISVKATTTERLGFTGRGEGIAAMASVSVSLQMHKAPNAIE
ncbi:MAG: bifunctional 2-C-methyl-D-erythritol 4-phosphate cytidylyltransferase/2-C-methyl-D-erythritol 2,4-cyclodiphosphate synthase [Pseudomonadota bacterium]